MIETGMDYRLRLLGAMLAGVLLLTVAARSGETKPQPTEIEKGKSGKFSILTYNVAGLPEPFSGSRPARNSALISSRLNAFDIVVTQEDFHYHEDLKSQALHSYISPGNRQGTLGDGLSRFSRFPISEEKHLAWEKCHGTFGHANDCLTRKGFSFARHQIGPGVWLDIYDLHLDAGDSRGDRAVRTLQMDQLLAAIGTISAGQAVLVAGDFNLDGDNEKDLACLAKLLDAEHFIDSCRALGCGRERIDRILFRSGASLELKPVAYRVEVDRFADAEGGQLSDHKAVSVVMEWKIIGE